MRLLASLLLALSITAQSQSFMRRWVDMGDEQNYGTISGAEHLGAALLDGYLKGDLKSYHFDISSDTAGATPKFPGSQDITTQAEFMSAFLVGIDPGADSSWNAQRRFVIDDNVLFKGRLFTSTSENQNRPPDTSPQDWTAAEYFPVFNEPSTLSIASVLYWIDHGKVIPQMLSICFKRSFNEPVQCPALNFYYEEVAEYLMKRELLYFFASSRLGYTGAPQLLLNNHTGEALVRFLHSRINDKLYLPSRKEILDADQFQQFLTDDPGSVYDYPLPVQDMVTHDLVVLRRDRKEQGAIKPVAKLKWKKLKSVLEDEVNQTRLSGYLDMIDAGTFVAFDEKTLDITLQPRLSALQSAGIPANLFFIDRRAARVDKNLVIANAIQASWSATIEAWKDTIVTANDDDLMIYKCDHALPELMIANGDQEWLLAKGWNFYWKNNYQLDSTDVARPVTLLRVYYKRKVSTRKGRGKAFEPTGIAFVFVRSPVLISPHYFSWSEFLKATAGRKECVALIEAVTKGKLVFETSQAVTGLVGTSRP